MVGERAEPSKQEPTFPGEVHITPDGACVVDFKLDSLIAEAADPTIGRTNRDTLLPFLRLTGPQRIFAGLAEIDRRGYTVREWGFPIMGSRLQLAQDGLSSRSVTVPVQEIEGFTAKVEQKPQTAQ